jgi:hypothetical protein
MIKLTLTQEQREYLNDYFERYPHHNSLGSGILVIPEGFSPDEPAMSNDEFVAALMDAMTEPIEDEE